MAKRKFRKLKGVDKLNDEYAQKHDRRPFIFSFVTSDGGTMETQGNVSKSNAAKMFDIHKQIQELHDEGQPE